MSLCAQQVSLWALLYPAAPPASNWAALNLFVSVWLTAAVGGGWDQHGYLSEMSRMNDSMATVVKTLWCLWYPMAIAWIAASRNFQTDIHLPLSFYLYNSLKINAQPPTGASFAIKCYQQDLKAVCEDFFKWFHLIDLISYNLLSTAAALELHKCHIIMMMIWDHPKSLNGIKNSWLPIQRVTWSV